MATALIANNRKKNTKKEVADFQAIEIPKLKNDRHSSGGANHSR